MHNKHRSTVTVKKECAKVFNIIICAMLNLPDLTKHGIQDQMIFCLAFGFQMLPVTAKRLHKESHTGPQIQGIKWSHVW